MQSADSVPAGISHQLIQASGTQKASRSLSLYHQVLPHTSLYLAKSLRAAPVSAQPQSLWSHETCVCRSWIHSPRVLHSWIAMLSLPHEMILCSAFLISPSDRQEWMFVVVKCHTAVGDRVVLCWWASPKPTSGHSHFLWVAHSKQP